MSKDKLIEKLKERFKKFTDNIKKVLDEKFKDETDILHCTTMTHYNYYNKYNW